MKKILVFCFCAFTFIGCKTDSLGEVLQAWQGLTVPVETKRGVVSNFDNDSAAIKEVLSNSYDLFLKGDLHKSVEYYYFKEKWQKESFYQNFYKRSSLHNRNIKELGGIASRDIMVLTKSDDGKNAKAQVVTKYNNGKIDTSRIMNMVKQGSRWFKAFVYKSEDY